jgi:four helix bundle protein
MSSTIAEGAGADTNREFARYLDISIKSANETEERLLKARDHGLIDDQLWSKLTGETIEIRKMTYGYRKAVLESARREEEEVRKGKPNRRATAAAAPK